MKYTEDVSLILHLCQSLMVPGHVNVALAPELCRARGTTGHLDLYSLINFILIERVLYLEDAAVRVEEMPEVLHDVSGLTAALACYLLHPTTGEAALSQVGDLLITTASCPPHPDAVDAHLGEASVLPGVLLPLTVLPGGKHLYVLETALHLDVLHHVVSHLLASKQRSIAGPQ